MTGNTATDDGCAIAINKEDLNGKEYDAEIDIMYVNISDTHAEKNGRVTLDTENLFAYIFGYTDNTVKPETM